MRTSSRPWLPVIGVLVGLCLAAGQSPEPEQDTPSTESGACVEVSVYYWLLGGPDTYVIGPDHCVLGTPWSGGRTIAADVPVDAVGTGAGVKIFLPEPSGPGGR